MNQMFLLPPLIGIEMLRLLSEDGSIHTGNIGTYMSRPICDSYIEQSSFLLASLVRFINGGEVGTPLNELLIKDGLEWILIHGPILR